MHSLRQRWTNLILHTSALIQRRKQELLTAHAGQAFVVVMSLIVSEAWLAIISLPLYLVARSTGDQNQSGVTQYAVRRVVTMSVLVAVLVAWLVKLMIILILSWNAGPQTTFQEVPTKNTEATNQLTVEVDLAKVDPAIAAPQITAVHRRRSAVTIDGTAQPKMTVVTILNRTGRDQATVPPVLYAGQTDAAGYFSITEDTSIFWLPPGEYAASALTYNPTKATKSSVSPGVKFTLSDVQSRHVLSQIDNVMNLAVIVLVLAGIAVTVLST